MKSEFNFKKFEVEKLNKSIDKHLEIIKKKDTSFTVERKKQKKDTKKKKEKNAKKFR